jgi:hypothetical protein
MRGLALRSTEYLTLAPALVARGLSIRAVPNKRREPLSRILLPGAHSAPEPAGKLKNRNCAADVKVG